MGALTQLNYGCAALRDGTVGSRLNKIMATLLNMSLSSAGLAIGSGSKKAVKIANTVTYLNDGVFCSKTTAEVAFTATTHDIAAHATNIKEACYLISLIADGTPTITMGDIAVGEGNATVPAVPSGKTPIGYVRIHVHAGATPFDATSDDLDAAHLGVTYVNLGVSNGTGLLTTIS